MTLFLVLFDDVKLHQITVLHFKVKQQKYNSGFSLVRNDALHASIYCLTHAMRHYIKSGLQIKKNINTTPIKNRVKAKAILKILAN